MTQPPIPGFRDVPRTGVIYVMHRATELGFSYDSPESVSYTHLTLPTSDLV